MTPTYPIYEHFKSFQGEGVYMGQPSFFIRTMGCPVGCEWCDSAGTWKPEHAPKDLQRMTTAELVSLIEQSECRRVIVTGGEPAIHDWRPLLEASRAALPSVLFHMETSGAFQIKGEFDWITLSPKWKKTPIVETWNQASEIKIIVDKVGAVKEWLDFIADNFALPIHSNHPDLPIWLHPEWTQRANWEILEEIVTAIKTSDQNIYDLRAGYQLHKLFQADNLDPNARPVVPVYG